MSWQELGPCGAHQAAGWLSFDLWFWKLWILSGKMKIFFGVKKTRPTSCIMSGGYGLTSLNLHLLGGCHLLRKTWALEELSKQNAYQVVPICLPLPGPIWSSPDNMSAAAVKIQFHWVYLGPRSSPSIISCWGTSGVSLTKGWGKLSLQTQKIKRETTTINEKHCRIFSFTNSWLRGQTIHLSWPVLTWTKSHHFTKCRHSSTWFTEFTLRY